MLKWLKGFFTGVFLMIEVATAFALGVALYVIGSGSKKKEKSRYYR